MDIGGQVRNVVDPGVWGALDSGYLLTKVETF